MIHQCQHCELRFRTEGELTEHLGHDHPRDTSVYERYRYPAEHAGDAPLYTDMREGRSSTVPPDREPADDQR